MKISLETINCFDICHRNEQIYVDNWITFSNTPSTSSSTPVSTNAENREKILKMQVFVQSQFEELI